MLQSKKTLFIKIVLVCFFTNSCDFITKPFSKSPLSKKFSSTLKCSTLKNNWGNPRTCSCQNKKAFYEEKIGSCLHGEKDFKEQTLTGIFRSNILSIGGETTGYTLTIGHKIYDLYLKPSDKKNLQKSNGKHIKVKGLYFIIDGTEIKERKAFIVKELFL